MNKIELVQHELDFILQDSTAGKHVPQEELLGQPKRSGSLSGALRLESLIQKGIALYKLTELINFSLFEFETYLQQTGSFTPAQSGAKVVLLELKGKLDEIRERMPPGICNPPVVSPIPSMFTVFFGSNPDRIFEEVTQNSTVSPETFIGSHGLGIDEVEKVLLPKLREFLQEMNNKGMFTTYYMLGPIVFPSIETFNQLLGTNLFTYSQDGEELASDIESCIRNQAKELQSLIDKTSKKSAKPTATDVIKLHTMLRLLKTQKQVLDSMSHSGPPGIIFEHLKNLIVLTTLSYPNKKLASERDIEILKASLLFLKKHCTPEEFARHIKEMEGSINLTISGSKIPFLKKATFSFKDEYKDIIQPVEKTDPHADRSPTLTA